MLSLHALSNWEAAVLASIAGASGTIEERDAQITRSGMYAEYPAIFSSYLELARDADDPATAREALKRAVFIAWYSFVEVPIVSAISELPESSVRELMDLLGRAIEKESIDDEMRLMLAWYAGTFGYPFEHYGPVRGIEGFVDTLPKEEVRRRASTMNANNRGQLGAYWKGVAV
jgi:hypothetical protein